MVSSPAIPVWAGLSGGLVKERSHMLLSGGKQLYRGGTIRETEFRIGSSRPLPVVPLRFLGPRQHRQRCRLRNEQGTRVGR